MDEKRPPLLSAMTQPPTVAFGPIDSRDIFENSRRIDELYQQKMEWLRRSNKRLESDAERIDKILGDTQGVLKKIGEAEGAMKFLAKENKHLRLPVKSVLIAQAVALTYVNAVRQLGVPFPWNLFAAASTISAGIKSVNEIRRLEFEHGGPVFGPSHAGGGVIAELEGGENVWSKRDVEAVGGQKALESMKPARRGIFTEVSQQERRARRAEYMGWTRRSA